MEVEQLAEDQREQHVHRHDDQRVNEQHRRLGEDADNRSRRADDRKKDVDQKGADLVGARRVVERLGEGGGADHGQGGHNQVLVAQQLVEDKARALGGEKPGEKVCDRGRDRHDDEGGSDVKGDILQRDGLCIPEFPGAAALSGLHLVDQRVGVVPAEKGDGRHGDQHKEVERHQQVVRHHRLGTHLPGSAEGVGHRDKVDRAADIGAGEHGGHLVQLREQVVQQKESAQRADGGAHRADEKDQQQPPAFPANPLDVALEQQQRDGQRHDVVPNGVVHRRFGGDDAEVGEEHHGDQGDDAAGDLGGPAETLLQPDGEGRHADQNGPQRPGVVRMDECVHGKKLPRLYFLHCIIFCRGLSMKKRSSRVESSFFAENFSARTLRTARQRSRTPCAPGAGGRSAG